MKWRNGVMASKAASKMAQHRAAAAAYGNGSMAAALAYGGSVWRKRKAAKIKIK
jgi:hypothetical protein